MMRQQHELTCMLAFTRVLPRRLFLRSIASHAFPTFIGQSRTLWQGLYPGEDCEIRLKNCRVRECDDRQLDGASLAGCCSGDRIGEWKVAPNSRFTQIVVRLLFVLQCARCWKWMKWTLQILIFPFVGTIPCNVWITLHNKKIFIGNLRWKVF